MRGPLYGSVVRDRDGTPYPMDRGTQRSLRLSILVSVIPVLSRHAGHLAVAVLIELELHLGIDAIELRLREGAQLAFYGSARACELGFLVGDLHHYILESVFTHVGRHFLGGQL